MALKYIYIRQGILLSDFLDIWLYFVIVQDLQIWHQNKFVLMHTPNALETGYQEVFAGRETKGLANSWYIWRAWMELERLIPWAFTLINWVIFLHNVEEYRRYQRLNSKDNLWWTIDWCICLMVLSSLGHNYILFCVMEFFNLSQKYCWGGKIYEHLIDDFIQEYWY